MDILREAPNTHLKPKTMNSFISVKSLYLADFMELTLGGSSHDHP